MHRYFSSSVFLLTGFLVVAQPSTDVYLFDLKNEDGKFSISNPKNISDNEGYNNQPSFWPDGKSILYARTEDGQTEIAQYFIESEKTKIITNTKQGSEYSPTPMPDGRISSIRLDTTGLQLLYAYNLQGESEILVSDLKIGYHAWINEKEIVTFVLGEPATLQVVDTGNGKSTIVADSIGRSLHKIPITDRFSFVDKSKKEWIITSMDQDGNSKRLTNTLLDSEDYCWTPTGQIIMGQGNKLFSWVDDEDWKEFADLNEFELGNISRMAVSSDGNRLVLVVNN